MDVDDILRRLERVKRNGAGWTARCPAHDDRSPSLSVGTGSDGRVLLRCHAGCEPEAVVGALGLTLADLFAGGIDVADAPLVKTRSAAPRPTVSEDDVERWYRQLVEKPENVARLAESRAWSRDAIEQLKVGYVHTDEAVKLNKASGKIGRIIFPSRDETGALTGGVLYATPKALVGAPEGTSKSVALAGAPRALFPPPESIIGDGPVWLVEGEPDAVAATAAGMRAIAVPGVQGWRSEWCDRFARFSEVRVLLDADEPGHAAAQRIATDLAYHGVPAKVIELPTTDSIKDVTDYLLAAGTDAVGAVRLLDSIASGTTYESDEINEASTEYGLLLSSTSSNSLVRPMLSGDAFVGLAGRAVALWNSHTEADPAGILVQFLAASGVLLNRGPYFRVGASDHRAALSVLIVGPTSTGRKGESFNAVSRILERADEEWNRSRIIRGLGSGEALIESIRDPRIDTGDDGEPHLVDEGVIDKRRIVLASEFGRILAVGKRESSTLSPILRELWDGGTLQNTTRSKPLIATGHHVAVLGQITPSELRSLLEAVDAANGFLNRFLIVYVRRQVELPIPVAPPVDAIDAVAAELRQVVAYSDRAREMRFDRDAEALYRIEYKRLTRERGGLVGELLARAAPNTLRLALIYALLDRSESVRVEHLRAAIAIVDYTEASARMIFGSGTGNSTADAIAVGLEDVGAAGLTRSEISRTLFAGNAPKDRLDAALRILAESGIAVSEREPTGGRAAERWRLARHAASERPHVASSARR